MATTYEPEKQQFATESTNGPPRYVEEPGIRKGFPGLIDSFKRNPNVAITPKGTVGADGHVFNSEAAALATANSPLERRLKSRHLQMIAIGGSIGMLRFCSLDTQSLTWADLGIRNWSIRWFRQRFEHWRSSGTDPRIRSDRRDAILHCSRSRRTRSSLSCGRIILGLFDPVH